MKQIYRHNKPEIEPSIDDVQKNSHKRKKKKEWLIIRYWVVSLEHYQETLKKYKHDSTWKLKFEKERDVINFLNSSGIMVPGENDIYVIFRPDGSIYKQNGDFNKIDMIRTSWRNLEKDFENSQKTA